MNSTPHYLLFAESGCSIPEGPSWRFLLQEVGSNHRLVVTDHEPATCGERLELLAVVRGLEAIDGPARVTLVTKSRYVSRGFRAGLAEWRAAGWHWERFGRIVPVKDHDLWQRVDRALQFHEVDCQAWLFADSAESVAEPVETSSAVPLDSSETPLVEVAKPRPRRPAASTRRTPGRSAQWGDMGRKIMSWVEGPGAPGRLATGAT